MSSIITPFPVKRSRRLRRTDWIRDLVSENQISISDLIWPIFICEGHNQINEIILRMVIYGVALLSFCMLLGIILGEFLGRLFGIDANIGGIGIAMLLLIFLSDHLKKSFRLGEISEKGITFWSMIYIPIVVAMASKQNVLGAIDGGLIALLSGGVAVLLSFLLIPVLSKIKK